MPLKGPINSLAPLDIFYAAPRGRAEAQRHGCFFWMQVKAGPCRPFVSVTRRMYHCHLNARLRKMERSQEMDGMRRRNENQSLSGLQVMDEDNTHVPAGRKTQTWHKFNWRKEELATLKTAFNHLVFTNYTHAEKKNDELMSHVVLLWNARCRHWSPSPLYPVSGLLLIAIGSTAAHTRDPLITHPFSECPSVIQLMQSFMWPFRSILPEEKQSKGVTRLGPNIGFMASLLWLFRYLKFNSRLLTICRWNGNFHWNLCSNATLTHGDSAVAALKTGTFDLKMGETMF